MSDRTRLRGAAPRRSGPYPLGEIPDSVALAIGRQIAHRIAVGHADITGDDFGQIFSNAISGLHRASPLGIADVEWNGCAWSVKTVKATRPFSETSVRLISGRNSPVYSSDILNPFIDLQATGRAILSVWNCRVDEAFKEHDDLRIFVLIRNVPALQFTMFETEAVRFIPDNYNWTKNARGNLEGHDIQTRLHCFTWQPHGSQFTILRTIPACVYRFRINRKPGLLEAHQVLTLIGFDDSWIERVDGSGQDASSI